MGPLLSNKWVAGQQDGPFKQQRTSNREQGSQQISSTSCGRAKSAEARRKGKQIQIPLTIGEIQEAQAQLHDKTKALQREAARAQASLELEGIGALKRKNSDRAADEEGNKRPVGSGGLGQQKASVHINLNPEGHYQISLEDDFCQKIGEGCGLKKNDVLEALLVDNRERSEVPTKEFTSEGIDQSIFDTELNERLGSEDEEED